MRSARGLTGSPGLSTELDLLEYRTPDRERTRPEWKVRQVLTDDSTWAPQPDADHQYLLSLPPTGWDAFVDTSQTFFDRLFNQ